MVATDLCGEVFLASPVLDAHTRIAEFGGDIKGYDEVAEMVLLEADAMRRWLSEAPAVGQVVLAEALHEVANNCAIVGGQRCDETGRGRASERGLVEELRHSAWILPCRRRPDRRSWRA
jgi:hypothetical protein